MLPDTLLLEGRKVTADISAATTACVETWSMDAADTFTVDLDDTFRTLLASSVLRRRTRLDLDGLAYELVGVVKGGDAVSLTFEDADVARLRSQSGRLTVAGLTRTEFAKRLTRQVPGLEFRGEPGSTRKLRLTKGTSDGDEDAWEALQRLAAERQWRCFVHRHVLWFGSDAWLHKQRDVVALSESTEGVEAVDFTYDVGVRDWRDDTQRAADATVVAHAGRWSLPPGTPVRLTDPWVTEGIWLVAERTRTPSDKLTTLVLTRRQPELPEPKVDVSDADSGSLGGGASVGGGAPSPQGYIWPVSGTISAGGQFGASRDGGARSHAGIDIAAPAGTPVRAAKAGRVTVAGVLSGYGNAVYINHGDAITRYGHLSRISTAVGRQVARGEVIGNVGSTGTSTGNHLHFEVRPGDVARNPLDYLP